MTGPLCLQDMVSWQQSGHSSLYTGTCPAVCNSIASACYCLPSKGTWPLEALALEGRIQEGKEGSASSTGLGFMTCFCPWNINKQDVNRVLESHLYTGIALLECCLTTKKPGLACWRNTWPHHHQYELPDMYTRPLATIQLQRSCQKTAVTWVIPGENSRMTTQLSVVKVVNALDYKQIKWWLFVRQECVFTSELPSS